MSDGWVGKEPCPKCGSEDNLRRHSDGHAHCFTPGCTYRERADGNRVTTKPKDDETVFLEVEGEFQALIKRSIREEVCKHFGYRVGELNGKPVQLAYYYDLDTRQPIACKVRFPPDPKTGKKDFTFLGNPAKAPLYGQWLYRDGGKKVVVCEGEVDALSIGQAQGVKWPVVSVKNGADGALKDIKNNLEWLCKFEEVILMFDQDEPHYRKDGTGPFFPGQDAAKACAALFPPGKCKIATLPPGYKDANELLQAGKAPEIVNAIWGAKEYRPDGIIDGTAITKEELREPVKGYTLRLPKLNTMIGGIREAELTLLTAGSGIGKSTFAREIAYGLHQDYGLTIGNVYLEEKYKKTAQGYIAIHNNVPLGELRKNPAILSDEQWDQSLIEVIHKRMFFYDHFGSMDSDNLLAKLRYMRVVLGCHFVVLDHISIVVSGAEGSGEGERRDIDKLMTKLRSLVEETGLGIIAIVHLKQPEGKPHEEGGRVTLSQLRGSGALKQLSDNVIALERNQQGDNPNLSQSRVLKCREFGETGEADTLEYIRDTGRFLPVEDEPQFTDQSGEKPDF